MSFSVSRDRGLYEWAGTSLSALFAQPVNLFSPAQWRMVWDILRFNAGALDMLRKGDEGESIGDYLKREGFSDAFRNNYLLPMTAAIWSTPPDQAALDFPAFTLLRFMHNHVSTPSSPSAITVFSSPCITASSANSRPTTLVDAQIWISLLRQLYPLPSTSIAISSK